MLHKKSKKKRKRPFQNVCVFEKRKGSEEGAYVFLYFFLKKGIQNGKGNLIASKNDCVFFYVFKT